MIIPKKNHCPKCGAFVGTAVCNNMLCLTENNFDFRDAKRMARDLLTCPQCHENMSLESIAGITVKVGNVELCSADCADAWSERKE